MGGFAEAGTMDAGAVNAETTCRGATQPRITPTISTANQSSNAAKITRGTARTASRNPISLSAIALPSFIIHGIDYAAHFNVCAWKMQALFCNKVNRPAVRGILRRFFERTSRQESAARIQGGTGR
jgi:hypothetical protein